MPVWTTPQHARRSALSLLCPHACDLKNDLGPPQRRGSARQTRELSMRRPFSQTSTMTSGTLQSRPAWISTRSFDEGARNKVADGKSSTFPKKTL